MAQPAAEGPEPMTPIITLERSFEKEIEQLRIGDGETFRGEGILAITKALLQSGVAYVGGYQGAPVSNLLDVLVSARDYMAELGIHVESCSNEASAAAMLAASINYPVRGAVTWKSVVGTNVASDALSNLSSAGVCGGALIVAGEDYGEGASIIQERTYAYALKSTLALLDPRPNHTTMTDMVEHGFALSEASNMPAILQLRIRACHVQGAFKAKDNLRPTFGTDNRISEPAPFDYAKLAHPPVTFHHEILKVRQRIPAAQAYIEKHKLNETWPGRKTRKIGLIMQGGLYNTVVRQLAEMGLADDDGRPDIDLLALNVTFPLSDREIAKFARGKSHVLILEEGYPKFIEQRILQIVTAHKCATAMHGEDYFEGAGEYTGEAVTDGLARFLRDHGGSKIDQQAIAKRHRSLKKIRRRLDKVTDQALPPRPPGFCTGCPERPVFGAIKLVEREIGKIHVGADIGCHSFGTFPPFSMGNSILGFGMSLASNAAVTALQARRTLAIMGDGGFWHNGLQSGVVSNLYNKGDGVLLIMQNGYTSATGQQLIPSSPGATATGFQTSADIARTLDALGVKWLKTVHTYSVGKMVETLKAAFTTAEKGLKVIIAEGECMLARQRRQRGQKEKAIAAGERVEHAKFGVDDTICTGDHSCIRLSGCPTLTIKPNPDPLRSDPVAHVEQGCLACGLCGEMAHAAVLCPSFHRAARIHNPKPLERWLHGLRRRVIGALAEAD
jgi:indolepyruvate ferredoxin oxidoreductase alpha subunit